MSDEVVLRVNVQSPQDLVLDEGRILEPKHIFRGNVVGEAHGRGLLIRCSPTCQFVCPSQRLTVGIRVPSPPNGLPPSITFSALEAFARIFPPGVDRLPKKRKCSGHRGFPLGGLNLNNRSPPPLRKGGAVLVLSRFRGVAKH